MDERTIQRAIRGSDEARAELVRGLQDVWFRFCLSQLGGDADRAADAAQETALRFLRQLPGFRGESRIQSWSLGIALNVVREMRRRPGRPGADMALAGRAARWGEEAPDERPARAEAAAVLHATLAGLPERQREAIVLRFFEELSTEETARAMGCAAGTVKATVHQALRSLREKLTQLM